MKSPLENIITKRICGALLYLIFLELILRMGGFIHLHIQERGNEINLKLGEEYRILCLGGSMTFLGGEEAYPAQLEQLLSSNPHRIHFNVINKSIPAANSTKILSLLEINLDKYQPHMVTVLTGLVDQEVTDHKMQSAWLKTLNRLHSFRLVKRLLSKTAEGEHSNPHAAFLGKVSAAERKLKQNPSSKGFMQVGALYKAADEYKKAEENFLKAVKLKPNNLEALARLGHLYRDLGEFNKASEIFTLVIEKGPRNSMVTMRSFAFLAETYKLMGKNDLTKMVYLKALEVYPRHATINGELGKQLVEERKYEEAEQYLRQQLKINSNDPNAYSYLAYCYRKRNKDDAALALLNKGIELNPESEALHIDLGSWFMEKGMYEQAEGVFKRCLAIESKDISITQVDVRELLAESYQAQGKEKEAAVLWKEIRDATSNYKTITKKNYMALKETLETRHIQLVAIQYPLKDVDVLKDMLEPVGTTIFVDNKFSFEKALQEGKYDDYFVDRLTGEFGHLTAKGNKIMAENLAKVILENLDLEDR